MYKSIRDMRRDRYLTQADVAKALKVSLPTYAGWEKDLSGAKVKDLFRVARFYGVNPWEITLCPGMPQKLM